MNGLELVRRRRSVRTFDGKVVSAEDREKVQAIMEAAGNPYGLPVRFCWLSAGKDRLSAPVISGAQTYIAGVIRREQHAEEAFGYAFEQLVLETEKLGLGTTWIAGTMNRKAFEDACGLEEGEVMPCVTPLGYPASKMSLRETVMRKGVHADSRLEIPEIAFDHSFDHPFMNSDNGALLNVLEMVRWAPSAVNRQPWRIVLDGTRVHFFEKKSRGYTDASGWDIQKVDVGIAMYHFVLGMEETGRKADMVVSDPGLGLPEDMQYIATFECGTE